MGILKRILTYKSEETRGKVVLVSPRDTSKACSRCGSVKDVLSLCECVYSSSNCGLEIVRDVNAARNILRLAHAMSSAEISAGEFWNEVKEIDDIGLCRSVVERTQNSIMAHKSFI